jgi:hypothetical protein
MEDQIAIVHEVAFDPPLWLQRRGWILNVLRKERVHTVRYTTTGIDLRT